MEESLVYDFVLPLPMGSFDGYEHAEQSFVTLGT
jgi:hypothetical protein